MRLSGAGFDLNPGEHPIIPVLLGDARLALAHYLGEVRLDAPAADDPLCTDAPARFLAQATHQQTVLRAPPHAAPLALAEAQGRTRAVVELTETAPDGSATTYYQRVTTTRENGEVRIVSIEENSEGASE